MAKRHSPRFEIQSSFEIGQEWELMFLGKLYPAERGGSQHTIDVIFASVTPIAGSQGEITFTIENCRRGVAELPYLIPGTIWKDSLGDRDKPIRKQIGFSTEAFEGGTEFQLLASSRMQTLALEQVAPARTTRRQRLAYALNHYGNVEVIRVLAAGKENEKPRVLLIPPIEIFRYALCKTPELARLFFHSTNEAPAKFIEIRQIDNRRVAILESRRAITDDFASTIALVGTNPRLKNLAESGFSAVRKCLNAIGEVVQTGAFLACAPYWPDTSKIYVSASLIQFGGRAFFGNFVQHIIDDDSDLPFEEIAIIEHQDIAVNSDGSNHDSLFVEGRPKLSGEVVDPKIGPAQPGSMLEFSVELPRSHFRKRDVPISRHKAGREVPYLRIRHVNSPDRIGAVSLGESTGTDRSIVEADVQQIRPEDDDTLRPLRCLWRAAAILGERNHWVVKSVTSSNPSKIPIDPVIPSAFFSRFPLVNQRYKAWASFRLDRKTYSRLALIVCFENRGRFAYAFELQKVRAEERFCLLICAQNSRAKMEMVTSDRILSEVADKRGVWANSDILKNSCSTALVRHTSGREDANELANVIGPELRAILSD